MGVRWGGGVDTFVKYVVHRTRADATSVRIRRLTASRWQLHSAAVPAASAAAISLGRSTLRTVWIVNYSEDIDHPADVPMSIQCRQKLHYFPRSISPFRRLATEVSGRQNRRTPDRRPPTFISKLAQKCRIFFIIKNKITQNNVKMTSKWLLKYWYLLFHD